MTSYISGVPVDVRTVPKKRDEQIVAWLGGNFITWSRDVLMVRQADNSSVATRPGWILARYADGALLSVSPAAAARIIARNHYLVVQPEESLAQALDRDDLQEGRPVPAAVPAEDMLRDVIRTQIAASDVNQVNLARMINVAEQHLSCVLRGKKRLTLHMAEKILAALGLRLDIRVRRGLSVQERRDYDLTHRSEPSEWRGTGETE